MALTFISACTDCGKRIQTRIDQEAAPVCHACRRKRKGLPPDQPGTYVPVFVPQTLTCKTCGAAFEQQRWGQKYCDVSCRSRRPDPGWNKAGKLAAAHRNARRRRALHQATWDGVTDEQILARDRWMCWICRTRIGRKFRYPHPRSASIDHELPLSLGGDDTAFNKRAAHLGCNMARGAARDGGQLPLASALAGGGVHA